MNILHGVSGSVAAIRADRVLHALQAHGEVQVVATAAAEHFLPPLEATVHRDADDWRRWRTLGDPVLHIELRRWADVLVVAPLSANTLAKLAGGLCDNLLTSVVRAWDYGQPLLVAPAMNTLMWTHPATAGQLDRLRSWGAVVIEPVAKELACGDVGAGAMATPETITAAVGASAGATEPPAG